MSGFISYPYAVGIVGVDVGGAALIAGEIDAMGIDFTYQTDTTKQVKIVDTVTPANNYTGTAQGKLTYTSPSVKMTRRANGVYSLTNGTTDLPFEWDTAGNSVGILIEEQRTNKCLRSQELDHADWNTHQNVTTTADAVTAPDGTTTAETLTDDATNSDHRIAQQNATLGTVTGTYTYSIFAKRGTLTWFQLLINDGTTPFWANFNLATGAVGNKHASATSTIIADTNGWYRCTITAALNPIANIGIQVVLLSSNVSSANQSYVGSGQTHQFWGVQVEIGGFASSYIQTAGAGVTRAADNITLATSSYPHSDAVGTLVVAANMVNASVLAFQVALSVDNNTTAERQIIYKDNTGLSLVGQTQDGGVAQASLVMGNVTANTPFKAAHAYTLNDMAAVLNGGTVQTDATGTMPTLTSMKFGQNADNTLQLNGYLRQITYLKRRATNTELQTRTT